MKNWEVAIIVVAVAFVALMWWKAHAQTQTANPTNSASAGLQKSNCGAIL